MALKGPLHARSSPPRAPGSLFFRASTHPTLFLVNTANCEASGDRSACGAVTHADGVPRNRPTTGAKPSGHGRHGQHHGPFWGLRTRRSLPGGTLKPCRTARWAPGDRVLAQDIHRSAAFVITLTPEPGGAPETQIPGSHAAARKAEHGFGRGRAGREHSRPDPLTAGGESADGAHAPPASGPRPPPHNLL